MRVKCRLGVSSSAVWCVVGRACCVVCAPAEVRSRVPAAGTAAVQQVLPKQCPCRPSCRRLLHSWFRLMFPNLDCQICILEPLCPHIQALIKDALKAVGQLPWPCRSEPLA